jgi:hypothetical protein
MTWQAYYQNTSPQAAGKVGSFWWRDVCKLITNFRGISVCSPGNGSSDMLMKHMYTFFNHADTPWVDMT